MNYALEEQKLIHRNSRGHSESFVSTNSFSPELKSPGKEMETDDEDMNLRLSRHTAASRLKMSRFGSESPKGPLSNMRIQANYERSDRLGGSVIHPLTMDSKTDRYPDNIRTSTVSPGGVELQKLDFTKKSDSQILDNYYGANDPLQQQKNNAYVRFKDDTNFRNAQDSFKNVQKLAKLRKLIRIFTFCAYIIVFMAIIIGALKLLVVRDTIGYKGANSFSIYMQNCALQIRDNDGSMSKDPVFIQYNISRQFAAGDNDRIPTGLSHGVANGVHVISAKNVYDAKYCGITIYVTPGFQLGNLFISCLTCGILQDTNTQVHLTGTLNLTGDFVSANFRDISVGSLYYNSLSGYLQLTNIQFSNASSVNSIYMRREGDIIVQSVTDFELNIASDTQAFCFAAPNIVQVSSSDCAISGNSNSSTYKGLTTCTMQYQICMYSPCNTTLPLISIVSYSGNVYGNIVDASLLYIVSNGTTTHGQTYDDGLGLSPSLKQGMKDYLAAYADDSKPSPYYHIDVGDFKSHSSRFARFIITPSKAYAVMQPHTISTMSGGIVSGYRVEAAGALLPGVCPYIYLYLLTDYAKMTTMFNNYTSNTGSFLGYLSDLSDIDFLIPGIRYSYELKYVGKHGGYAVDFWYWFEQRPDGSVVSYFITQTDEPLILTALVLSMLVAFLAAAMLMEIVIKGIVLAFNKIVGLSSHLKAYSQMEKSMQVTVSLPKRKLPNNETAIKKYTFIDLIKGGVNLFQFVDYMTFLIHAEVTSSAEQFYRIIFKKISAREGSLDDKKCSMKGSDIKVLYEKFCFLSHRTEEKLVDNFNRSILAKYGYDIETRHDLPSNVFTKINIKNYDAFLVELTDDEKALDSLELYKARNFDVTNFDEDQVEVDVFVKLYEDFCDLNRLEAIRITPAVMKERFGILNIETPQQFIVRKHEQEEKEVVAASFSEKIKKRCSRRTVKTADQVYIVDTTRIEKWYRIIINDAADRIDKDTSLELMNTILYPRLWWAMEPLAVLIHFAVGAMFTIPWLMIVLLYQNEYAKFSGKDRHVLIEFADIIRDPNLLLYNLYHSAFAWTKGITACVIAIWAVQLIDQVTYYVKMEFPENRAFIQPKSYWGWHSLRIQWIILGGTLYGCLIYLFVVLVWVLLGVIISPNAYLPFASAAITFVTFVISKYRSFQKTYQELRKRAAGYLEDVFLKLQNEAANKLLNMAETVAGSALEKGKNMLQSGAVKSATNKLVDAGVVDPKVIEVYEQKVQNLNVQAIGSSVAAVVNRPDLIKEELNKLKGSLKDNAINRIRQICTEKGFSNDVADLFVGFSLREDDKAKEAVKSLLRDQQLKMTKVQKKAFDGILDVIFLNSANDRQQLLKTTIAVLVQCFSDLDANTCKIVAEVFFCCFENVSNLRSLDIEQFIEGVNKALSLIKQGEASEEKDILVQTLRVLSTISKSVDNTQVIQGPLLLLINSVMQFIAKKTLKTDVERISRDFINITSIILPGLEANSAFSSVKSSTPEDKLNIISRFCDSAGLNIKDVPHNLIPNVIYLAHAFSKQDLSSIPPFLMSDIKGLLSIESVSDSFLLNCFKLALSVTNTPLQSYNRLDLLCKGSNLSAEFTDLLKGLMMHPMKEFNSYIPDLTKNKYFQKIASAVELKPTELMGFMSLLSNKLNDRHLTSFVKGVMNRINTPEEGLDTIREVLTLFLSYDESALLVAARRLCLTDESFLLVGKGLLNPKFVANEDFMKLGLTEIELKDTIYNSSEEEYQVWKNKLAKDLQTRIEASSGDTTQERTVKFYLSDLDPLHLTRKDIVTSLELISNSSNRLSGILKSRSANFSTTNIDMIITLLLGGSLNLQHGVRYTRFGQERENAVNSLAASLNVNPEPLRNFVKMIVLDNVDTVVKCLFSLLPEEKQTENICRKILTSGLSQMRTIASQSNLLPNDKNAGAPLMKTLLSQIVSNENSGSNLNDLLELASAVKPVRDHTFIHSCYTAGLLAKGVVSDSFLRQHSVPPDSPLVKLFDVFSQQDVSRRLTTITSIFARDDHPLKILLALHGLLSHHDVQICSSSLSGASISAKIYLSHVLRVDTAAFDLFELLREKDVAKFTAKAFPLLLRLGTKANIDIKVLSGLLSLSLIEHFDSTHLAATLHLSPKLIDFFVTISRLALTGTRDKELNALSDRTAFRETLLKLNVQPSELVALVRIAFSSFESSDVLSETLASLGLEGGVTTPVVVKHHCRGLLAIQAESTHVTILTNKHHVAALNSQCRPLLRGLQLNKHEDLPFLLSRLAAGNYLVLRDEEGRFSWAIPQKDTTLKIATRNLLMGVCGLINPNVPLTQDMTAKVHSFVAKFQEHGFRDLKHQPQNQIVPDNSLAYAVYLAHQTLDVRTTWTQAFLLDKDIYSSAETFNSIYTAQFMLAVVLNFKNMSRSVQDFIGFYEWTANCRKLSSSGNPNAEDKSNGGVEQELCILLAKSVTFEYQDVVSLAKAEKLVQSPYWSDVLQLSNESDSEVKFNTNVNRTIHSLLSQGTNPLIKSGRFGGLSKYLQLAPKDFLSRAAAEYSASKESITEVTLGRLIRDTLVRGYQNFMNESANEKDRIQGYELTNLSMLGTLASLRDSSRLKKAHGRAISDLYHLATNFERKMYLDEFFYKFSRFRFMKITGLALGLQVYDIFDWCLPSPLLSDRVLEKFERADTEESRLKFKRAQYQDVIQKAATINLQEILTTLKQADKNSFDLIEWTRREEKVGCRDLFLEASRIFLHFKGYYDPQALYIKLAAKDRGFISSASSGRVGSSKDIAVINQEKRDKAVDFRTDLPINTLNDMVAQFEDSLNSPNMSFILDISNGNSSAVLKYNNVITNSSADQRTAKVYSAILELRNFRRQKIKNSKILTDCIETIAPELKSDLVKVKELIMFFTGGTMDLSNITNTLGINDQLTDVLLMRVKEERKKHGKLGDDQEAEGARERNEADEEAKRIDNLKKLGDLVGMNELEVENFQLLREIYLLEGNWTHILEVLTNGSQGRMEDQTRGLLANLFTQVQLEERREKFISEIDSEEISDILKAKLNQQSESQNTLFQIIFETLQKLKFFKSSEGSASDLLNHALFLKNLVNHDTDKLLRTLVYAQNNEFELDEHSPVELFAKTKRTSYIDTLLEYLNKHSTSSQRLNDKHTKIFKIFIALIAKKSSSTPDASAYELFSKGLVQDIIDLEIFMPKGRENQEICRLLLGMLFGDKTLFLDALHINPSTGEPAILPSIFKTSNDFNEGSINPEVQILLKTFLSQRTSKGVPGSVPNLISKSLSDLTFSTDLKRGRNLSQVLKSIYDGSFFTLLLDAGIQDQRLKGLIKNLLLLIINVGEKCFATQDNEANEEVDLVANFQSAVDSLNKLVPNKFWNVILDITPIFTDFYTKLHSQTSSHQTGAQADAFFMMKKMLSAMIKDWEYKDLTFTLLTVVSGFDMDSTSSRSIKLSRDERKQIFLTKVLPMLIPSESGLKNIDYESVYRDLSDQKRGLMPITKNVVTALSANGAVSQEYVTIFLDLADGKLEGLKKLIHLALNTNKVKGLDEILDYMQKAKDILSGSAIQVPSSLTVKLPEKEKTLTNGAWSVLMKKVHEGKISSRDLFLIADQEGDQNGFINEAEFQMLVNRLGFKISKHRIKEIFSEVKLNSSSKTTTDQLDEKEFAQAIDYIKHKNMNSTLDYFGITPVNLTIILIKLMVILILIFAFLFVGIKVLAATTTFGAIVNSLLAVVSGVGLDQKKEADSENMDDKSIADTTDKGLETLSSDKL